MRDFIDLQINGCWGIDFNSDDLTDEGWATACDRLFKSGTTKFLPTVITDGVESLERKLDRVARLCEETPSDTAHPIGIHLEGPFISSEVGFIGAHPREHAMSATIDIAKRFLEAARGRIKMVTLAPEMDQGGRVTRWLSDQHILVAAGHTDASLDELNCCVDQGMRAFTHFGNGCPPILPRHDNILHRVMSLRDRLQVTLIADGAHLPVWMLKMCLDWFGYERSIIVSDAISAAGLPSGYHSLGQRRVWVDQDGVPRSEDRSHFVGSGATLDKMQRLLSEEVGIEANNLERILRDNASRLLNSL